MSTHCTTNITVGGTPLQSFQNLHIHETMNGHHSFACNVFVDHIQPDGDAFALASGFIGQSFDVTISPSSDQVQHNGNLKSGDFSGVVMHAFAGNHGGEKGQATITISGYSATKLLEDDPHTAAHYQSTLAGIIGATLIPYPSSVLKKDISPAHAAPLEYVVQNRESSWQFLKRMAARFGEWCFYDGQKLVFSSAASNGNVSMKLHADLMSFDMAMNVAPTKVQIKWWDYMNKEKEDKVIWDYSSDEVGWTGGNKYSSTATAASTGLYAKEAFEKFLDPYQISQPMATHIKFGRVSQMVHLFGRSGNPSAGVAKGLSLLPSDRGEKAPDVAFFITEVEHFAQGNGEYYNTFVAIPKSAAYPPAEVMHAPPCDAQSATVTDNDDPEHMGRIKVRLRWQASPIKTDWIRIVTPHAGKDKGMYFIPELGEEVWVDFEGGNPDKPYMLGAMYNKMFAIPANDNLKDHKTIPIGFKTNDIKMITTRSGHTIEFNDKKGEETITITDKKKNSIVIDTKKEEITISSLKKINIVSKEININGSDKVNINSKEVTVNGTTSIKENGGTVAITAKSTMDVKGVNTTVEGSAKLTAKGGISNFEADGINTVKGSIVKIN